MEESTSWRLRDSGLGSNTSKGISYLGAAEEEAIHPVVAIANYCFLSRLGFLSADLEIWPCFLFSPAQVQPDFIFQIEARARNPIFLVRPKG